MRKSLRFYAALWTAKAASSVLKLMHRNATHLPGLIAMRMCPDFLGRIDKPETIIAVTGTNGKTTVCNLIDDILPDCGVLPLNNRSGGNISEGIASTLIAASSLGGRVKDKVAVLEVDERTTVHIFKHITPDYLLVTNLFRDSFKRNAHSEFITAILNRSIPATTKLIVNADDLISSHLAPDNARVAFGIAHREDDWETPQNIVCDIVTCPVCSQDLQFDFVRYNHIGRAHCPSCDYGSLTPQYDLIAADETARTMTVRTPAGDETYRLLGDNITDWYNTLAAVALLRELGHDAATIAASLDKQTIVRSRYDRLEKDGKAVTMQLAKGQNPIACSRVFDFIRRTPGNKAVILLVEDYFDAKHSTENIAWLYDADFEFLCDDTVKQILVAGVRAADFRVRLLMAGIPDDRIVCMREEIATADAVDYTAVDNAFVLYDVYTVMFAEAVRDRLKERLGFDAAEEGQA